MTSPAVAPRDAAGYGIISETFTSFQGEGPYTGQRCAFVRFAHCNLRCGWCDTKISWDWRTYRPSEVTKRMPVPELASWVTAQNVDLLVITGGEPLLQSAAMATLAQAVPDTVRVQVETNGTRLPEQALVDRVDMWVASPKLANSGMDFGTRIVPTALAALMATGRAVFKFVVTNHHIDFEEISALVRDFDLGPIWVMPEGETAEQVRAGTAALEAPAVERGWNVSTRLHILTGAR